ncbi:MAG: hypothetical protein ACLU1S_03600 [Eubacterium sp.]
MPRKQHIKQFKLDAINYRKEHPDFTQLQCAKNLGIGISNVATLIKVILTMPALNPSILS